MIRIGIAGDHGGFALKNRLAADLRERGYNVTDFGSTEFDQADDYPDFVIPLAKAVAAGKVKRGIAVCGSGVGACIAANKVAGVRAALVHEIYSAHQGVEDDNMNVICIGGRVAAPEFARELVVSFLHARYRNRVRFQRRLDKIETMANEKA